MFIIIGGDGKEYGPVSTDQVRTWIAAGRANLDTKAKAAGSEEWRRLGDFAEFSAPESVPPVFGEAAPELMVHGAEPASRGSRFGAALVDGVLKTLCWMPSTIGIGRALINDVVAGQQPSITTMMSAMNGILLKSLPFLLGLAIIQGVLLSRRGQSVGKMLVGLRIVRLRDGGQAGFLNAFLLRGTLPWVIEQIPLLGGLFWLVDACFIFSDDCRCVHDHIAGTKVVKVQAG